MIFAATIDLKSGNAGNNRGTVIVSIARMLDTAETVAHRYDISREHQDAYALLSQRRTAEVQSAGRFGQELISVRITKVLTDKAIGRKGVLANESKA
jgi:acetyl-CoA C-acetyltransferase